MDRLQKWFGLGRHGENVGENQTQRPTKPANLDTSSIVNIDDKTVLGLPFFPPSAISKPPPAITAHKTPAEPGANTPQQAEQKEYHNFFPSKDAPVTETRLGQLMNQGREMILQVIPLKEGDCLSCKLIGAGVMLGAAIFVLCVMPKRLKQFTGFKKKFYTIQAISLSIGLATLGTSRLFDIGLFTPPDADGNRKGLRELIEDDINNFNKLLDKVLPSKESSENRKDS